MITVIYDPDNIQSAVSDNQAELFAKDIIEKNLEAVIVSNSLVIMYLRLLVRNKKISNDLIQFKYKDEILTLNKKGQVGKWPIGFCDHELNILRELW